MTKSPPPGPATRRAGTPPAPAVVAMAALSRTGLLLSPAGKDLNLICRKRKHQFPAVVPLDIDLKPHVLSGSVLPDSPNGADGARWNWIVRLMYPGFSGNVGESGKP